MPAGCDVPAIDVRTEETGVCGYVDYMWFSSTEIAPNGSFYVPNNLILGTIWNLIPGENSATLDPGVIDQTTFYVRCARNFSCCDFGESNVVTYEVVAGALCVDVPSTVNEDCEGAYILTSPNNDYILGENVLYKTNQTISASSKVNNSSVLKFNAKTFTELQPGFEVGADGQLEVNTTGCND